MSGAADEQVEAWRAVAAGWERQRPLFWEATRLLSERLIALLDPLPGEILLELAAGPGDTGFLAAELLGPSGRLISSDVAPEMVEAARRRASSLDVTNAEFRVIDAGAIDLADASVDAVLCRFGLMLVGDVAKAFAEVKRILRPGGRAAIAVWAAPEANDWIAAGGKAAVSLGLVERPDPDAPGPFRLHDTSRLRALAEGAGLGIDTLEDATVGWRAGSADEWWQTTLDTSRMLSQLVDRLADDDVARLRAAAEARLAVYASPDGSLSVPGQARVALLRRAA